MKQHIRIFVGLLLILGAPVIFFGCSAAPTQKVSIGDISFTEMMSPEDLIETINTSVGDAYIQIRSYPVEQPEEILETEGALEEFLKYFIDSELQIIDGEGQIASIESVNISDVTAAKAILSVTHTPSADMYNWQCYVFLYKDKMYTIKYSVDENDFREEYQEILDTIIDSIEFN